MIVGFGIVYYGTGDNHLVALDAASGEEVWNVQIEDHSQCGCSASQGILLAGVGDRRRSRRCRSSQLYQCIRRQVWSSCVALVGDTGFTASQAMRRGPRICGNMAVVPHGMPAPTIRG